jgi:hypothetical protein
MASESDYIKALKIRYLTNGLNFIERQQSATLKKVLDGNEFVENMGGGTKYIQHIIGAGRGGSSFLATVDANGRAVRSPQKNYVEWTLLEKHLHEIIEVTDKSVLKTLNAPNPNALISAPDIEMATALGAIARYMAVCLFGSGHGEICELSGASAAALAGLTPGGNAVTITPEVSGCWKVRPGDRLFIAQGMIDGVVNRAAYMEVVSATPTSITLKSPAGATAPTVAEGDYLTFGWRKVVSGVYNADANAMDGLGSTLPGYKKRTGTAYNNWLAKPFKGVTRAGTDPYTLGNYILKDASMDIIDWFGYVISQAAQTGDGAELQAIINPNLANALVTKATSKPNGRVQIIQNSDKNEHNLSGIDGLIASFDNQRVTISISDVMAPTDLIRIGPKDDIRYYTLTSLSRVVRNILGKNAYESMKPENVYQLFYEHIDALNGFDFNRVIKPCGVVAPTDDNEMSRQFYMSEFGDFFVLNPHKWTVADTGVPITAANIANPF